MAKKSPNFLYELCIEETSHYLVDNRWNGENTNPFSQINCYIVNDLFQFLVINMNIEKPSPLELLLRVHNCKIWLLMELISQKKQWRSVMTILLEEGDSCRNITRILLPKSFQNDEKATLERLIEKCPYWKYWKYGHFQSVSIAEL
ncbi:hypothetical protein CEXT_15041 [Caerostris extrusa]|uniref:Uncharacterized protein n=1 Tax=Caerostris extrusa TaxID=172846 RepID=A0AAV4R7W1_CAEEX|nr:hypothetical protein CEXT_15041 [Caerostris extrusa]